MAKLKFTPTDVTLYLCYGLGSVDSLLYSADCYHALELSTGENIEDINKTVQIISSQTTEPTEDIGNLLYFERNDKTMYRTPSSIAVSIILPRQKFAELINAARQGKLPSKIEVDVREIETHASDSSPKRWDNKNIKQMPVRKYAFTMPLITADKISESDRLKTLTEMPANREQLDKLIARTLDLYILLKIIFWTILIVGTANAVINLFQ
jgi:hypothetical protein